jgi:protoporphyrinogen oxidase
MHIAMIGGGITCLSAVWEAYQRGIAISDWIRQGRTTTQKILNHD